MMAIGLKELCLEKELSIMPTVSPLLANGQTESQMVKVYSHGQMNQSILETLLTARNKVKANSIGLMVLNS